jgi:hypothetical protein
MKRFATFGALALCWFFILSSSMYSQPKRIVVLPFQNMNGLKSYNLLCYQLQDSLSKALTAKDPEGKYFYIIPADSIEIMLAELNVDPINPQYPTDMWKVIKMLNAKLVILGTLNVQDNNYLMNAYIYNVRTKIQNTQYKSLDIFKTETTVMEAIDIIVEDLLQGLIE